MWNSADREPCCNPGPGSACGQPHDCTRQRHVGRRPTPQRIDRLRAEERPSNVSPLNDIGGWMAARPTAVLEMIAISRAVIGPSASGSYHHRCSRCGLQLSSVAATRPIERSGRHHADTVRDWDPHSASQTTSRWSGTEGAHQRRVIGRPSMLGKPRSNAGSRQSRVPLAIAQCGPAGRRFPACVGVQLARKRASIAAGARLRKPGNGALRCDPREPVWRPLGETKRNGSHKNGGISNLFKLAVGPKAPQGAKCLVRSRVVG
jgi:hypothetical protein